MVESVTINHENIVYEDIGNGAPIIFIHPPGMGRKVFYKQKPLSKHFRLILPDLVGHGDSSYNGKSKITIKRFSEDIIALMDFLQLRTAVIFGYSAGGTIVQYLSIYYPTRVKSLILSGGYPIVDNVTLANEHRLGIITVEKNKWLLSYFLALTHTQNKKYRKILRDHMNKSNTKIWSKYYLESLQFNCKEKIKDIQRPTLLLYGSNADVINTYIKFYQKHLSNKEIFVFPGQSHQLPTKQPKHVNQIVTGYLFSIDTV